MNSRMSLARCFQLLFNLGVVMVLMTTVNSANADQIAELKVARRAHQKAVEEAENKFLESVNAELKKVASSGDLDAVNVILAEKEAFENRTGPVTQANLLGEIRRYVSEIKSADRALDRAYAKTVDALTRELLIDLATMVRSEQKDFEAWRQGPDGFSGDRGLLDDALLIWTFDNEETIQNDGMVTVRELNHEKNNARILGGRRHPRRPGMAMLFDRRGASLTSEHDVGITKRDPRTFAMFVAIAMPPSVRMDSLFGWGRNGRSQQFRWGFWKGRYRLWTYGDATTRSLFNVVRGWHHIAMTYDGRSLRSYLNGSTSDAVTFDLELNTMDSPLSLNNEFLGGIDEVIIFDRALDPEEVTELYNLSRRGLGPSSRRSAPARANTVAHRRRPWIGENPSN